MTKKILIVRLSAMGDVIFNLPLANILKNNGYEVTWLVSEKGFDIVNNNPAVDEAVLAPVEKWKKQSFFKNIKEYFQIIKYIRSKHFDIAIDTQLLLKSFIWTVLCGAKRRIVSKSAREFAILGGNEVIGKLANDFSTHAAVSYLEFAKHLNLDTNSIQTSLPPSTNDITNKIDNLLKDLDKNKPIITLAPATTWVTKHWNKDNWKELVSKLETNYNIIFTGTSKDLELIDYISEDKHLNLAGKTNLLELVELFRRTDLLISLDSGSTHLAWASGHPKIISIYCSTPPTRYAPIGDKYIALTGNLECQHCHKRKCPLKTNECTYSPKVEEVLAAINKLLPLNII
ncbi:MAG: glycosyltransferase family 9 protein [Candidatus Gastranaerophilales bacterium]|nr:glycosyltransferase family 9 protein [Candidatus Gastranaerophilales bacterium]MCM1072482.1 glycosyltransferase family 9 protein [Bacteroides sp.]